MSPGSSRLLLGALLLGAVAPVAAQERFSLEDRSGRRALMPSSDPSAIVRAEIAFAQLSRNEGQWTGFRKTADSDAVMFVPGIVNAQSWLRKRADPAKSVSWAPDRVFISCDATYGVALGHAEYADGRKGGYVTIWRRQDDGDYKWVLDWSTELPETKGDIDIIDGKVTDCPKRGPGEFGPGPGGPNAEGFIDQREMRKRMKRRKQNIVRIPNPPPAQGSGQSSDGSIRWTWSSAEDGARKLKVLVDYGGETVTFVDDDFPAGA